METGIFIKKGISYLLYHSGFLSVLTRKSRKKGEAVALMYHRIMDQGQAPHNWNQPGMYVTEAAFRSQLEYLKSHYEILPLQELISRLESNRPVGGCCAITFDDGWKDNYSQAFPILREFKVPATIFLATSFIGTTRNFWPEELVFYLSQINPISSFSGLPLLHKLFASLSTYSRGSDQFYDTAIINVKSWAPSEREKLFSELQTHAGIENSPRRKLMNWQEIKEMEKSGLISFGAHTANHVILDQVTMDEAEREIRQCRQEFKNHLGCKPELFAYPNGNHNKELKTILQKYGFKYAVTTRKAYINEQCDLLEIPRIGIHQDIGSTTPLFCARMVLKRF